MNKFLKKLIFFFEKKILRLLINLTLQRKKDNLNTKLFGSKINSWKIFPKYINNSSILISCGSGEDLSFEIELINKFNLNCFLVDPTPKAKDYYIKLLQNVGKTKTKEYNDSGGQPVEAYNLKNFKKDKINLIEKAISDKSEKDSRFYQPKIKNHISHSLIINPNININKDFILVDSIKLKDLMKSNKINQIDILKLDIEGMECKVLNDLLESKIFPKQICIELEVLDYLTYKNYKEIILTFSNLSRHGYECFCNKFITNKNYLGNFGENYIFLKIN